MALSPLTFNGSFSTKQTALMRERLARAARAPYNAQLDSIDGESFALRITPEYHAGLRNATMPAPSFSAQLLELGLHHKVDGLIQKAHEQLSCEGSTPRSAGHVATRHYEHAQDNFARETLHVVERNF